MKQVSLYYNSELKQVVNGKELSLILKTIQIPDKQELDKADEYDKLREIKLQLIEETKQKFQKAFEARD